MWMLTPHVSRARHFDDAELFDNLHANLEGLGGSPDAVGGLIGAALHRLAAPF